MCDFESVKQFFKREALIILTFVLIFLLLIFSCKKKESETNTSTKKEYNKQKNKITTNFYKTKKPTFLTKEKIPSSITKESFVEKTYDSTNVFSQTDSISTKDSSVYSYKTSNIEIADIKIQKNKLFINEDSIIVINKPFLEVYQHKNWFLGKKRIVMIIKNNNPIILDTIEKIIILKGSKIIETTFSDSISVNQY